MQQLGWVDLVMLGVLLLSLALGLWRGFVLEVLALIGWVVAYFAAQWLAPVWAPQLPLGEPSSNLNYAASFALAFVVVMVTFVAYLLNTWALRRVQPSVAGAFIYLQPALALVAAWYMAPGSLRLSWLQGLAAASIFTGVWLVGRREPASLAH